MVSTNKRTSMTLFSDPVDHYCQRVRIVLEEKGIFAEVVESEIIKLNNKSYDCYVVKARSIKKNNLLFKK